MMAQRIECHYDHEIVMARALPKPIPVDAAASALLMRQRIRQARSPGGNPSVRISVVWNAFLRSQKARSAMRPALAIALCVALSVSAGAQTASVDGRWTVTTEGASGTTD